MDGNQAARERSEDLAPGRGLRHRDGKVVTIDRRKTLGDGSAGSPWYPGWWLTDGSGLADFVIDEDDSYWTILPWTANQQCPATVLQMDMRFSMRSQCEGAEGHDGPHHVVMGACEPVASLVWESE